ncbi:MAG: hypothetical protein AB1345_09200 [Chloroflexota bacterium]
MLVIVSDLHLGDGTCGQSISPDAFNIFGDRLRTMAYSASWRKDGKYRPIETIDLLFLGDIFEVLHSTCWLDGGPEGSKAVKPWHDPESPAYAQKLDEITDAILEHNAEGLTVLKRMVQGDSVRILPADNRGNPARGTTERFEVKVRPFYVVGNHDWLYHLPGNEYDNIRKKIVQGMNLTNLATPFPHDPSESEQLLELYKQYGVYARHGDIFDAFNYNAELGRNASTLGDALAIEVLNRFPVEVQQRMGDSMPEEFYTNLRELVNVRPALATPLWVSAQLRKSRQDIAREDEVKAIWDELGERFLNLGFVRAHDQRWNPFDSVDMLEMVLKFSRRTSFETINDLVIWIQEKLWGGDISFSRHALAEEVFKQRSARFIVYGHIHNHEIIPLDTFFDGSSWVDQIYANTGTWRTYHDLTIYKPEEQKFVPYHVMSYLVFYKDDERRGRRFEAWSGALSRD